MDPAKNGAPPPEPSPGDRFGRTNWLLLVAGLVLLVLGFAVLSQGTPRAENLAGRLAPFLILGAYALIFVSLLLRSGR
jgi:hypothetical protein